MKEHLLFYMRNFNDKERHFFWFLLRTQIYEDEHFMFVNNWIVQKMPLSFWGANKKTKTLSRENCGGITMMIMWENDNLIIRLFGV